MLRALCALAALLTLACEGATRPSPLPPTGLWVGSHTIVACEAVGSNPCAGFPRTGSLTLTVDGAGADVSGALSIETLFPDNPNAPVGLGTIDFEMVGTQSSSGSLDLIAAYVQRATPFGVVSAYGDWTTTTSTHEMSGRFVHHVVGPFPGDFFASLTRNYTLVSEVHLTKRAVRR